jgi:hypothetical protein
MSVRCIRSTAVRQNSRRYSQRNVLNSRQVHVGFVVDKVALEYVYLPVRRLSPGISLQV